MSEKANRRKLNLKSLGNFSISKWLSNIWIISETGLCVFEQSFKEISMDADLIAGFLVAMKGFGREISDTDIKAILFRDLTITFRNRENFMVVIATSQQVPRIGAQKFLDFITKEFEDRYNEEMANWKGNLDIFDDFEKFIEDIVGIHAFRVKYLRNRMLKHRKIVIEQRKALIEDRKMKRKKTETKEKLLK